MFHGLLMNALSQIQTVEAFVDTHETYASQQPADRRKLIREYAVASCVTRLYAIYEHFVESIVADYLDAVPELMRFDVLNQNLRHEYRIGISHILSKIEHERYLHLQHENVVKWYHEALSNQATYRFVTEALTRHDENLRLAAVERMFGRIGLNNFRDWIAHSREILSLYEDQKSMWEQLEAEVRTFVQIRNDAAHGSLETLEGKENLLRYCRLISSAAHAITGFLHKQLLLQKVAVGRLRCVGKVTEVFPRPGAVIAQLAAGTELSVGMSLQLVGTAYCATHTIESLQIDGQSVESVQATVDGFEVGIKCGTLSPTNVEIFSG